MQSPLKRGSKDPKAPSGQTPKGQDSGGSKSGLRGLDYQSGAKWLEPGQAQDRQAPGEGAPSGAPVQAKLSRGLPKPNLKSRLLQSTYAKVHDLYTKVQKAKKKGDEQSLLQQLEAALAEWANRKDDDDSRKPAVLALLEEVVSKLHAPPSTPSPDAPSTEGSSAPESTTAPTTSETTAQTTQTTQTTAPIPTTTTPEPASTSTTPTTAPITTPPVTTTTTPEPTTPTTTSTAPTTAPITTPELTSTTPTVTPTPTTTPSPTEPAWKTDPTILLPVTDITKLGYDDCIAYLDSRPQSHVESLGKDNAFIGYAIGFDVEKTAQIAVRLILRTPDAVVEKGASRAEAIRIMSSQLRDKGIIRRLLAAEVRVVIVPANKLMTDLPEFAAQKGTYTFDGRPWDTVRGLGGQNTAITEENLLGITELDSSTSRKGWKDQTSMDEAIKNGNVAPNEAGKDGPVDSDAVINNPGVYCEGYSTTNHEFFHTIHMFGLNKQDNKLIETEYNAKKSLPQSTQWADGPRMMPDGTTPSENYASSTVYEYFAQTGCAFQGTNTGTDPYTGCDRNNGRSWVTANEPGLAGLLSRICSDSELTKINPTTARKAQDEKKKTPVTTTTGTAPTTGPSSPPPTTSAPKPTTKKDAPPPTTEGAMGFIQEK